MTQRLAAFLGILGSALMTAACAAPATSPALTKPGAALRNLNIVGRSPDAQVEVMDIIQPGDSTSWAERAQWTELVVRITNVSAETVAMGSAMLVDSRGVALPHLTSAPAAQTSPPRDGQDGEAARSAAPAALEKVAARIAHNAASSVLGALPVDVRPYVEPLVSTGKDLASTAISSARPGSTSAPAREQTEIQAELERRRLREETRLVPGGAIEGSLFFQFTPVPHRLVLTPESGERLGPVDVPLARGLAAFNATVTRVVLTTERGEYALEPQRTSPVTTAGAQLRTLTVALSRPLTAIELTTLSVRVGSSSSGCGRPQIVGTDRARARITIGQFAPDCLRRLSGRSEVGIEGLNVTPQLFVFVHRAS
jgi:hypothetical protein